MPDNKIQVCISISKDNINIISKALEDYWSHVYHSAHTINEINDARVRIGQIKEQMGKLNEIKICWG
jgi:hypothetical protein